MKINSILAALLLIGVVDQINDDAILVEYINGGRTSYSTVSLAQSACVPREGQKVHFYKDYKVVTCEETGAGWLDLYPVWRNYRTA